MAGPKGQPYVHNTYLIECAPLALLASLLHNWFLEIYIRLRGGSFFSKSPRYLKIGRGHGSDFVHIVFLNTLRHAKTKSEVLGPSLTWFGNNG